MKLWEFCITWKIQIVQGSEHAGRKIGLFGEKNPIYDCSRSNQMP